MLLVCGAKSRAIPWPEIPFIVLLDTDMILKTTIYAPGAPSIEDLAEFLNDGIYPGITKELAEIFLKPVRAFAEEVVEFTDEVARMLADPVAFFDKEYCDFWRNHEASQALWELTQNFLFHNKDEAEINYGTRAIRAIFLFGLKSYYDSIVDGGFALNEKEIPDFAQQSAARTKRVTDVLVDIEKTKAEILIELIKKYRSK